MTQNAAVSTVAPRTHRFLARTFSAARWAEYDKLLRTALAEGWKAMGLEQWVASGGPQGRVMVVRHDVDQHPASAVRMARIDARYGVRGTWYFRWRTCAPTAIRRIRTMGGTIGLHYETLTRLALERGLAAEQVDESLIEEARHELQREIVAFQHRVGQVASICAHGDTRVPGVSNQVLVGGLDEAQLGGMFDAGEALSRCRLGLWMTDRSSSDGRWKDRIDPLRVLRDGNDPILCLTHPNNWCSGIALWSDRVRAAMLPTPAPGHATLRMRDDRPPEGHSSTTRRTGVVLAPQLRTAPSVRPFSPIAEMLRREIVRYCYDTGRPLTTVSWQRTLDTNSLLAEARTRMLDRMLERAEVSSVRGLDVLDLGCGFGALTLVLAARGANVTALDSNGARVEVGERVAAKFGLSPRWIIDGMETANLDEQRFDLVVMNNSLCYLVEPARRRQALERTLNALRPGGVLVIRSPKRFWLRDPFTRLPLLGLLPPGPAGAVSRLVRLQRPDVRLLSTTAAVRELRAAGYVSVESVSNGEPGALIDRFCYQHLLARRPVW